MGAVVSWPHSVQEPALVFRESPNGDRVSSQKLSLSSCPDMLNLPPDRKFHLAPCVLPSLPLISLLSIRIKMLRMSEDFQMMFLMKPSPPQKNLSIFCIVSVLSRDTYVHEI